MTAADIMTAAVFPYKLRTAAQYRAHVRKTIIRAGYTPVAATYDQAGNCLTCGECGRCPGWHTTEEGRLTP